MGGAHADTCTHKALLQQTRNTQDILSMARHSSSVFSCRSSVLPEELLVLQVHELLVLEFPARGLEASSEPAAAARAGARTEEVELWDKK